MTPFEVAEALRLCLIQEYGGDAETPAEICHRPGDEVPLNAGFTTDECCSGLAWVRVASVESVITDLDSESASFNPCYDRERRVTVELGVARCNPFGDASGGPSCEAWTALALRMDQDRAVMVRASCCAAGVLGDDIIRLRVVRWEPFPSGGGCAGGTLTLSVWLDCSEC